MTVYTWLVVLLLLAALLMANNLKGKKKFTVVAFLLLFCVIALRDVYTIGNDSTSSYLHEFERMQDTEWSEVNGRGEASYNQGFSYLMKLGYEITNGDYRLFLAILYGFIMLSYGHLVSKYSPSPTQSVLYFLGLLNYFFLFDALKQAIAMSVLIYAFDAIMGRKPVKFIVLTVLASWFHFPALIFLPAYWIAKMKIGRSYIIFLVGILVATYLLRDDMLQLMLKAYGSESANTTMDGVQFLRNKAIIMIVIVVAALMLRPISEEDKTYTALLKFAGIAIVFQTFCGYNNIFERLAEYYFHFSIALLPLIFEKCELKKMFFEPKTDRMIKTVAPIVFCAFAVWRFLTYADNNEALSPYVFFFQSTIE